MKQWLRGVSVGSWRFAICCVIAMAAVIATMLTTTAAHAASACTLLTSGQDTTDASSYLTASVTSTTGAVLILGYGFDRADAGVAAAPTVSGHGTWTTVRGGALASGTDRYSAAAWAPVVSGSTGTVSFTHANGANGMEWVLVQCTGLDTTNPINNSWFNTGTGTTASSGAFTITDTASGYMTFLRDQNGATSHTPNQLTELADVAHSSPNRSLSGAFSATWAATGGSLSESMTSAQWRYIGLELKLAGAPTTTTTAAPTTTTTTAATTTTTSAAAACNAGGLTLDQSKLCAIAYDTERQRAEILTALCIIIAVGGASFIAGLWLKA